MCARTRMRPVLFLATAITGFLVAHSLDYLAVYAHPHERALALEATGHGYLDSARLAGTVALLLALLAAAAAGADRRAGRPTYRAGAAIAALTAAQTAVFVGAEIGERVVAGSSLHDLVHSALLPLGVALQPVVAAAVVALLVTVERLVASVVPPVLVLPVLGVLRPAIAVPAPILHRSRPVSSHRGRAPPWVG